LSLLTLDNQTSFTLCCGVGVENFGKVGIFCKLGDLAGHFTSDYATLFGR